MIFISDNKMWSGLVGKTPSELGRNFSRRKEIYIMSNFASNETGINLRIVTDAGEIKLKSVIEYVCGRLYFYINPGKTQEVQKIERSIIKKVFRFTDEREWPVNLKTFKDK